MRIGLFGGTFDPIHQGHLILAERCRESARLDEVWFLPSFKPPHKADRTITRFDQRCEMVTLATTGQPAFRMEPIEKELPEPSYTVATLNALQQRNPEAEFALILGADSAVDLVNWYRPTEVVAVAELVLVPRPGVELWTQERIAQNLNVEPNTVRLTHVDTPLIEIASSDIRQRVAEGQTIRYLLPRAVEEYIRERTLYRQG